MTLNKLLSLDISIFLVAKIEILTQQWVSVGIKMRTKRLVSGKISKMLVDPESDFLRRLDSFLLATKEPLEFL